MPGEWPDEVTQIRALPFVGADRILVADCDLYRRSWMRAALAGHFGVEEVDNGRAALERLTQNAPRILIVGPELNDVSGGVLLAHAARHGLLSPQAGGPVTFLMAETLDATPKIDTEQVPIFYRLTMELAPERVRDLLAQAIARNPQQQVQKAPTEADAIRTRQILEHAKRLGAARDLKSASSAAVAAVIDLIGADRARCLFYDDESGSLWSESADESEQEETHASAGVSGFAVRCASAIVLPHASDDPVYLPAVDDPEGNGKERLAVQPVAGTDGVVHAVLIAVRAPDRPAFTDGDMKKLEELAGAWAPFVHQLAQEVEAEQVLEQRARGSEDDQIFRQEAIINLVRRGNQGDVVRVHPAWIRSAYWIVVASLIGTFAYAYFAHIHSYAEGPGVVRILGRHELSVNEGGTITGLAVKTGDTVTKDKLLASLHNTEQADRLRVLQAEHDRLLVLYMLGDKGVQGALSAKRAELDSARASLRAREIRAPADGVVKEVLVRNGQRVDAGKVVITIADKSEPESMVVYAFLPGADRPRLYPGQRLRLTLPGYRGAYLDMDVNSVSTEVLGPAEAKARFLDRHGDALPINGTVVVVDAKLSKTTFEADGERYDLHDGMAGVVEVQLDSKSVLETLIPGVAEL